MFRYGIEHEVVFIDKNANFVDFTNTSSQSFKEIIGDLPMYQSDYPTLNINNDGIKVKRWYVEGYDRFTVDGKFHDIVPKGIEIRTIPVDGIDKAVNELKKSHLMLKEVAYRKGYIPINLSYNPFKKIFRPDPPLNEFEIQKRNLSPESITADISVLTFGPDLNISMNPITTTQLIDIGKKLTYYSPFIVPFSFSAPFFNGKIWRGLSYRTYIRTGRRPAALVYVGAKDDMIVSNPSLTKLAYNESELGRIEFKAFDSCGNLNLYASLLALLKGLAIDKTLTGRALVPDPKLHQHAALYGFGSDLIYEESRRVLKSVEEVLDDAEKDLLIPLKEIIDKRESDVHIMRQVASESPSFNQALQLLTKDYTSIRQLI